MADPLLQVTSKRKRPHTDYSLCMICQANILKYPLQTLSEKGYPALKYAVENRADDIAYLEDDVKDNK